MWNPAARLRSSHRSSSLSCSGVTHGLFGSDSALRCWNQNAHAPGSLRSPYDAAPKCFFKTFRCYGRLIFRKSSSAFSSKRSPFRFASLTLRWAGEASLPPAPLSPAPEKAETDRRQSPSAGKALFRSTPWISLPLCISPGGLPLPAHAAPTGGKTCSCHSRRNTLAAPGLFLLSYRSFFFSYFS